MLRRDAPFSDEAEMGKPEYSVSEMGEREKTAGRDCLQWTSVGLDFNVQGKESLVVM